MYSSSSKRVPFNIRVKRRYCHASGSVGVTGCIFLAWLMSYYLMSVLSNIASSRSPDNRVYPRLPDIGFDLLPHLDQLWLTDLFDALLVLPTIVLVTTHRRPMHVANKWFLTSTLCNLERIASVAATSFPDPRPGCEKVTDQFLTSVSAHKCGDCMFSGHTVLFVICACVWTTHPPPTVHRVARVVTTLLAWSVVLAGSAVVIMNRAHYTVDVLVAWYLGIGNWYLVQYIWSVRLCARKAAAAAAAARRRSIIDLIANDDSSSHTFLSSSDGDDDDDDDDDEESSQQPIRLRSYDSVQLRAVPSIEQTANEKGIL